MKMLNQESRLIKQTYKRTSVHYMGMRSEWTRIQLTTYSEEMTFSRYTSGPYLSNKDDVNYLHSLFIISLTICYIVYRIMY